MLASGAVSLPPVTERSREEEGCGEVLRLKIVAQCSEWDEAGVQLGAGLSVEVIIYIYIYIFAALDASLCSMVDLAYIISGRRSDGRAGGFKFAIGDERMEVFRRGRKDTRAKLKLARCCTWSYRMVMERCF
jgi:hypothetical protein